MIATAQAARPTWLLPFGVTLVAMFTLQLSNLGFSPLLPSIQQDVRMSYTQLGLFTGLYGLLALLLSVPAGITARRFGEKRVLALGLVGVAIGSVLLGRASSFESALAFRGLVIFGYRFAFVSVLIAVALTSPLSLRGRTMGVLGATSAMASVVGAPLGGALAGELGWRIAILGYAFMALLGAAVFWHFYRPIVDAESVPAPAAAHSPTRASASAFRSPAVWLLALVVGLGGFGQFTITYFVPSVAKGVYGLDAAAAGLIISAGYVAAIVLNLVVGALADRFDKLVVLGAMFVLLAAASICLTIEHELVFRVASAVGIGFGFSAANQLYGLAGTLMPRGEAGNAMGIVSLGAGLFGYFGPQMLGILRDVTGSFSAGFVMIAAADLSTLVLVALLLLGVLQSSAFAQTGESARPKGDQHREYTFAPTGQRTPFRIYVPTRW
ncbi:MAG TPA: MFS transporter, partial [Gammaproteobacteria bacterium]|nr:MFS transporter [Gammaproteobacteria bacterium]